MAMGLQVVGLQPFTQNVKKVEVLMVHVAMFTCYRLTPLTNPLTSKTVDEKLKHYELKTKTKTFKMETSALTDAMYAVSFFWIILCCVPAKQSALTDR